MIVSTHACTSVRVFVYVSPLLPTDGNLRHNAGGPHPLPIHPRSFSLPPTPSEPHISPFPPHPYVLTKHKGSFNPAQTAPRTWPEALETSLCYHKKTNLAVHFDIIT